MRRYCVVTVLFLQSLFLQKGAVLAQQSPFVDQLLKNRYSLSVQEQSFSGIGAQPLKELLDGAQFVMVGEDHGTAEIPRFVSALCYTLAPQGFRTFAVESGPLVTPLLRQSSDSADHIARMADFEKKYPDSTAFFNLQQENDLITQCNKAFSPNGNFLLWGLDQELMGASGFILERILETHPGINAKAAIQDALKKEAEFHAKAATTGNPTDLYMLSATDEDVNHITGLLRSEGSVQAQSLWAQLLESRVIYQLNMTQGYDSNRRRALWMKTNFLRYYEQTSQAEKKAPKVLFKFGDWHVYKGFNPLYNNDLGNFVTELADGQHQKAANIIILGVQGPHLRFAGSGRPYRIDNSKMLDNPDYQFMKPLVDNLATDGWTVFDLRGLRKGFRSLGAVDASMERLIFGCDMLVLIPEVTASKQIQ